MVSLMRDGESAFENEVLGTQRLQRKMAGIEIRAQSQNPAQAPFNAHAVRFDWCAPHVPPPKRLACSVACAVLLQRCGNKSESGNCAGSRHLSSGSERRENDPVV